SAIRLRIDRASGSGWSPLSVAGRSVPLESCSNGELMMSNPIFCALDVPGVDEALSLGRRIAPHVGGLKLGLEFFCAVGPEGIRRVAEEAGLPIFLDLKFHDIPN